MAIKAVRVAVMSWRSQRGRVGQRSRRNGHGSAVSGRDHGEQDDLIEIEIRILLLNCTMKLTIDFIVFFVGDFVCMTLGQ